MFYEKLAEKKQERTNQGLSGGQMGAMAAGGLLGGAVGTEGTLRAFNKLDYLTDKFEDVDAIDDKYKDKVKAEEDALREEHHQKKMQLFEETQKQENPDWDAFDAKTRDMEAEYNKIKGQPLIQRNRAYQARQEELDAYFQNNRRRRMRATRIPALIGTAAGVYGAKKLYDKYRGNNQSNAV